MVSAIVFPFFKLVTSILTGDFLVNDCIIYVVSIPLPLAEIHLIWLLLVLTSRERAFPTKFLSWMTQPQLPSIEISPVTSFSIKKRGRSGKITRNRASVDGFHNGNARHFTLWNRPWLSQFKFHENVAHLYFSTTLLQANLGIRTLVRSRSTRSVHSCYCLLRVLSDLILCQNEHNFA